MGIEKNSLSIVRFMVFPNRLGRVTRETNALHSMNSEIRSVLSIIVKPRLTISLKLSKHTGVFSPAMRVAVPSMIVPKKGLV